MTSKNQIIYDSFAEEFSETRKYSWIEFFEFKKYLDKGSKVLDLGCGNGRLYDSLKDLDIDYTGVDISRNMLNEARKKYPDLRFLKDDICNLEALRNERFNAIFLIASFHHLNSREQRIKALMKIKSLLKENGKIFITNWNIFQIKYRKYIYKSILKSLISNSKWNDVYIPFKKDTKTVMRYYHAFTPSELRNLFKNTGLIVQDYFSFDKDKKIKFWWNGRNICFVLKNKTSI